MTNTNPHDALFKATMSHPSEVEALVRGFLPKILSESLDFSTLHMESTAYISADLREYFSDMSYTCHWKSDTNKPPAQITLLLEHKSYLPDNIHLQLLRYLTESYQHQYRQSKVLRLVLPIVVYHGDQTWSVRDFTAHFDLPNPELKRYLPLFSYELLDLSQVSERTLYQLEYGFMLSSTLLLYKYRRDNESFLRVVGKIFNFANQPDLPEDVMLQVFQQLLQYIYTSYKLTESDMEKLKASISESVAYLPGSLWDQAIREGKIEGELIATLDEELELLSRMAAQDLPYDLMRKLTDVPEALLLAFHEVYSPETAEHLLAQVRHARTLPDLPIIRQHLMESLLAFGITDAVAREYLGRGEVG